MEKKNIEKRGPIQARLYKAEVRKIPNFLSEEAFYHGFNVDLPIDFKYFVPGKTKERNDHSIAYYGFEHKQTLEQFIAKFNNFTIQDEKGKSYLLQVQRTIYQSLPLESRQQKQVVNKLENTIHEDEDYKAFIEKLNAKPAPPSVSQNEKVQSEVGGRNQPRGNKRVNIAAAVEEDAEIIDTSTTNNQLATDDIKSDATTVITANPVIKDETPVKPKKPVRIAPLVQAIIEKEQKYQEEKRSKHDRHNTNRQNKNKHGDKDNKGDRHTKKDRQSNQQDQQQQQPQQYRIKQKDNNTATGDVQSIGQISDHQTVQSQHSGSNQGSSSQYSNNKHHGDKYEDKRRGAAGDYKPNQYEHKDKYDKERDSYHNKQSYHNHRGGDQYQQQQHSSHSSSQHQDDKRQQNYRDDREHHNSNTQHQQHRDHQYIEKSMDALNNVESRKITAIENMQKLELAITHADQRSRIRRDIATRSSIYVAAILLFPVGAYVVYQLAAPYGALHNVKSTNGVYMYTPQNFMQRFRSVQQIYRPEFYFKDQYTSLNMYARRINKLRKEDAQAVSGAHYPTTWH